MDERHGWELDMNLEEYRREREMTYSQLTAFLGLTHCLAVQRWCSGEALPRPESLKMILEKTDGEVTLLAMLKCRLAHERANPRKLLRITRGVESVASPEPSCKRAN